MEEPVQDYAEESDYVVAHLDQPYIRKVAREVARALRANKPIEANYQPGDRTSYRLLFTPIQDLDVAPARETERLGKWDSRCPFGVARKTGAAVVSWVGNGAEGLDLAGGGFHGGYLDGLFKRGEASGWALAILFNAIAEEL